MIVVKIQGGLGNQMFQYAMGRSVALGRSATLLLDRSSYAKHRSRAYQLNVFAVEQRFATPEDLAKLRGPGYRSVRRRLFFLRHMAFRPYYRQPVFHERRHYEFDPHVFDATGDVYFVGGWQHWRYFSATEDLIRRELTLQVELTPAGRRFAELIEGQCSVAVHVRRGDYVSVAKYRDRYASCGLEYYRRAAAMMREQVGGPHFFVFSDDPEWAREHLDFLDPMTVVSGGDALPDYEDLWLMGQCRHFIIANSSFSWWGAWLGSDPNKVVIAPNEWLRGDGLTGADMCPPAWQRIPLL